MKILNKTLFWSAVAGILAIFLSLVTNTLIPFFIAFILAYLLQPLIDYYCVKYKIPRNIMVLIVFSLFLSGCIIILLLVIPMIYQQFAILISKIPVYQEYFQSQLVPMLTEKLQAIDPEIAVKIKKPIENFINGVFSLFAGALNNLWEYTKATINAVAIILLVPIILFYFLRDWHQMGVSLDETLPLQRRAKIKEILASIDELLSAYVRGQFNICIILSFFYSCGLAIIGIDLGLLLGILSGFLIIIPFIGTFLSLTISLIIGYFNFGFTVKLIYILGLYIAGHICEAYFLTPKIIGSRIGLHPLWIMFAVFACGNILGFAGVFFAIPILGIIKVLLNYAIRWYKTTDIYTR